MKLKKYLRIGEEMKRFKIILLSGLCFFLLSSSYGQWNQYDVPYVSTPYQVVMEMLETAKVNQNDILYDLGCGDGRIVITAAKKYGCRGVGVDLDPQRIKESRENAKKENVENRVKFIQKDLFEADISDASVVTLYLLSSVNLKLRPKLLQDLAPGTRIVSHDFSMGKWEADEEKEVFVGSDRHLIYFWVVPADVAGVWKWTLPDKNSLRHYEIELSQKFNEVWAFQKIGNSKKSIQDFELSGDQVSFTMDSNTEKGSKKMFFEGRVNGDNIYGGVLVMDSEKEERRSWKARRLPSELISKK